MTPARPAHTPTPALRKSHFPDPPTCTLPRQRPPAQTLHRSVPDALSQRRAAAAIKRGLLDGGEDRRTIDRRECGPLDTEGSHDRALDHRQRSFLTVEAGPTWYRHVNADVAGHLAVDARRDWDDSEGAELPSRHREEENSYLAQNP